MNDELKMRAEDFLADAAETPDVEINVRNGISVYGDKLRDAPNLVRGLLAKLEHSQSANRTLGDIVHRLNMMALDATGLHHVINEDGDGDWQAVWETLGDLGYRYEKLQKDRAVELASIAAKHDRDCARKARALAIVKQHASADLLARVTAALDGTDE